LYPNATPLELESPRFQLPTLRSSITKRKASLMAHSPRKALLEIEVIRAFEVAPSYS
jgi:hypothetical protein